MAYSVVVVCDVCGSSPAEAVGIKLKNRSLVKDLCARHVAELARGARAPRRGRPARAATNQAALGGPRHARGKASRRTSKQRPTAKAGGRKVTNPVTLEKRRAALKKARQVLAAKRATKKKAS